MAFKVKPFAEVISLTKEKLDEALAPVRARSAKAKTDMKQAELEEKMIGLERKISEKCADKDLDLDGVISLIDQYELTERKSKQVAKLIADLFPAKKK